MIQIYPEKVIQIIEESPWMTLKEAAEWLKISVATLRNYKSRGMITYYKNPVSGSVRFHRDDLNKWFSDFRFDSERV
ncbi:MAG: helix-turn-helix domain-containing protein [Desulfobacteraceae bacterium]|nr:helix-turn-helix domain-containing protein [Desulfobacteraceae bacterium]